jgi:hypothetical protein
VRSFLARRRVAVLRAQRLKRLAEILAESLGNYRPEMVSRALCESFEVQLPRPPPTSSSTSTSTSSSEVKVGGEAGRPRNNAVFWDRLVSEMVPPPFGCYATENATENGWGEETGVENRPEEGGEWLMRPPKLVLRFNQV